MGLVKKSSSGPIWLLVHPPPPLIDRRRIYENLHKKFIWVRWVVVSENLSAQFQSCWFTVSCFDSVIKIFKKTYLKNVKKKRAFFMWKKNTQFLNKISFSSYEDLFLWKWLEFFNEFVCLQRSIPCYFFHDTCTPTVWIHWNIDFLAFFLPCLHTL
jgi:hypothetical protein